MWPVSFIGKYFPPFFLCLIAGECHRSVNISTCWGYIPQDWRINAFACPGGVQERHPYWTVYTTCHVYIFFFNKSRLHTLQSSCVAMGTDTRCKQYFSLSYLVKFALYISLHAMWMYCNIRLGWRLRFNVNNSAYILCIMGLTSFFVQTIRHWQSFHISHRNAF